MRARPFNASLTATATSRLGPSSIWTWRYAGRRNSTLPRTPDRSTVGIKDVIDTFDMPTCHNSPLFVGNRPASDASCVAILRAAGALILGKTETTEFAAAGRNPRTGNSYDLERTSGGSSAGSAAAVADLHVPLWLGTQTGGSTMRPASFCGVYAFKPTWGAVSREGVRLFAASFDTVSWFARSVEDLDLVAGVFSVGATVSTPPSAGKPSYRLLPLAAVAVRRTLHACGVRASSGWTARSLRGGDRP